MTTDKRIDLTAAEQRILERSYDPGLTQRRQRAVLAVGAFAAVGVFFLSSVIENRPLIGALWALYVVITVVEKWAYGNGVLLYKSVIRKLDNHAKSMESGL